MAVPPGCHTVYKTSLPVVLPPWTYWLATSFLNFVPEFIVMVLLFLLRIIHTGFGKSYGKASMGINKETKILLGIQSPFKLMIWCFPFFKMRSQPSDIFNFMQSKSSSRPCTHWSCVARGFRRCGPPLFVCWNIASTFSCSFHDC